MLHNRDTGRLPDSQINSKLFGTTSDKSNSFLELYLKVYACKMNLDPNPNPNRDYPNNLLDTILLLGYNDRIEWLEYNIVVGWTLNFPNIP